MVAYKVAQLSDAVMTYYKHTLHNLIIAQHAHVTMNSTIGYETGDINESADRSESSTHKIIADAINILKQNDETDTELLDILISRITTLSPDNDAVDQAMKDIRALATKRGTSDG